MMTSILTKYISKRILGESMKNNFGKEVSRLELHTQNFERTPTDMIKGSIFRAGSCYKITWTPVTWTPITWTPVVED